MFWVGSQAYGTGPDAWEEADGVDGEVCKVRLVVDTDVLRSGLQSDAGASRALLLAAGQGIVTLIVSVSMLCEYEAVLKRPHSLQAIGLTAVQVDELLDDLLRLAEPVIVQRRVRPSIQDPDDEMFVEAFVNGQADAIVTFNVRDCLHTDQRMASMGLSPVPALRPGEIMRRLAWQPTPSTPSVFPRR